MLSKLKNSKGQGFTIIEVMIVLAVAGLILLIVLLAVPALQRSSRNTQRKNDISALAGAVANYISNNNGTVPNNITLSGSTAKVDCSGTISTNCSNTDKNTETANVGLFTSILPTTYSNGLAGPTDTNTVFYVPKATCNSTNTGIGSSNSRSAAFLYMLEPSSNECQEQ